MSRRPKVSGSSTLENSLTQMQADVRAVGEQYWLNQVERSSNKWVLLVEGETDRAFVEAAFESKSLAWSNRVFVIGVGGRAKVLHSLERSTLPYGVKLKQDPAHIFGLVDRDVWTDQEVDAQRLRLPNLHVTEGWCVENSLLLNEQGLVLPALDSVDLEAWADSCTLGWAIQSAIEAHPRTAGSLYEGVSPQRLDWSNLEQLESIVAPLLPDGAQRWADALSAQAVVNKAASRRATLDGLRREELLLKGIHGKVFVKASDVHGHLGKLEDSTDTIRLSPASNLRHRPFMQALIQALGLSSP